jgi:hypothetical protein
MKLQLVEDNPFEGRLGYDEPAPVVPDALGNLPEWEVEEILDAKHCIPTLPRLSLSVGT